MYGDDLEKQTTILTGLETARRAVMAAYREYYDNHKLLPGVQQNYDNKFNEVMDTLRTLVKETAIGIANYAQIKVREMVE